MFSTRAQAYHSMCTPEVNQVASIKTVRVGCRRHHFQVRDAARLLHQAASGLDQRPLGLLLTSRHPHTAHAQNGQVGFAAQCQVPLHTRATLNGALLGCDSFPDVKQTTHLVQSMQMKNNLLQHLFR